MLAVRFNDKKDRQSTYSITKQYFLSFRAPTSDMLVVRFNDKKEIYFLSTMHQANIVETGERNRHGNNVRQLQVVNDYKYMGGLDLNDELIGIYCCVRKSKKWTKKVAFHFIEEGVLHAHILYKKRGEENHFSAPQSTKHIHLIIREMTAILHGGREHKSCCKALKEDQEYDCTFSLGNHVCPNTACD